MTHPSFTEFCERTLRIRFEPAQRVYYAVACGEQQPDDLEGADRELAREIFGAIFYVSDEARDVVATVKGADVGATFLGGCHSLWRALTAERDDAASGEVRPSLIVAPDLRLGRKPVQIARGFAERVPAIASLIENTTADAIVFRRKGGWFTSVECLPATVSGRATRGRRYLDVKLDEASFFRDEATGAVNDTHVFQSVVARCIGQVWLQSTPWVETNLIWQLYEANFGNPTTALAARLPTTLVRTSERARKMVERERLRDPDNAAREYDCTPVTGGASMFFDPHAIANAMVETLLPFARRVPEVA